MKTVSLIHVLSLVAAVAPAEPANDRPVPATEATKPTSGNDGDGTKHGDELDFLTDPLTDAQRRKLQLAIRNPLSNLTRLGVLHTLTFGAGSNDDGFGYVLRLQPIVPGRFGKENVLLLTRASMDVIYRGALEPGGTDQWGFGDLATVTFVGPNWDRPVSIGIGPALTGSNGTEGPTSATSGDGDAGPQDASSSTAADDDGGASTMQSGTTGDDSGSTGAADETGTTGGELDCTRRIPGVDEISPGCVGYVEILTECYGERLSRECIAYEQAVCQYQVHYDTMLFGEDCGAAYEELYVCLSMLTCREFEGPRTPCGPQAMAWMTSCGG